MALKKSKNGFPIISDTLTAGHSLGVFRFAVTKARKEIFFSKNRATYVLKLYICYLKAI